MQDMNEEQVNGHKGLVTIAEKVIPKAQGEAREATANAAEPPLPKPDGLLCYIGIGHRTSLLRSPVKTGPDLHVQARANDIVVTT
jgi:hypothetical protein